MKGQFSKLDKQSQVIRDISSKYGGDLSRASSKDLSDIKKAEGQIKAAQSMLKNQTQYLGDYMNMLGQSGVVRGSGQSGRVSSYASITRQQRTTVNQLLGANYKNTKVARAFAAQFVDAKTSDVSQAGEMTAQRIQNQDRFIHRLVRAFATLPIFSKAGRAFQQLGVMTMTSGVARFRQGGLKNQALGIGQFAGGLAEYFAPQLASLLVNGIIAAITMRTAIRAIATAVGGGAAEAVAGSSFISTLWTTIKEAFLRALPYIARALPPLIIAAGTAMATMDLWGRGEAYKKSSNKRDRAMGEQMQGFSIMTAVAGAGAVLASAAAAAGAAAAAPIAVLLAGIAGATYLIGRNIDKIWHGVDTFVGWIVGFKNWLGERLKHLNPFHKDDDDKNGKKNPSFMGIPIGIDQIIQSVSGKNVKPTDVHTFSTDRFNIYQYGSSQGERGGATVMGHKYTKEQLEAMGAAGKGGLETLQGLNLANTFYNDARVARTGSSAILQAVQAKTGVPLTITSAMASSTSGHALGKLGHEGGQKFDFSAAGMDKKQALQYAQTLYATGYFSHAEAEYDKKTGQWHIDARISDQAYKTVEEIQKQTEQQKQAELKKTSPRVKEAPGTAKVTDVVNGSLGLRNSLYGPALGI